MQPEVTMGRNRTGLKASPLDAAELLARQPPRAMSGAPPVTAEQLRREYMDAAGSVGSVPPPSNLRGVVGATVQAFGGHRMHVLLDRMAERLAFERSGVRLYDAMLIKAAQADVLPGDLDLEVLRAIRDDEAAHFALLAQSIERLGGDSTTQTPCADVAGVQGLGLMQVMNDPRTTLSQALQTLLAAELIDNASWELLIELAEGFGQDELVNAFSQALANEQRHEARVRAWLADDLQRISMVRH